MLYTDTNTNSDMYSVIANHRSPKFQLLNSFPQLSCTKDQLKQLESRLSQAIAMYKRRLEWLTTESRRIFGVVEEKSACFVLDVSNLSPRMFDQYRSAVERVIREQMSNMAKFNLIRCVKYNLSSQYITRL